MIYQALIRLLGLHIDKFHNTKGQVALKLTVQVGKPRLRQPKLCLSLHSQKGINRVR